LIGRLGSLVGLITGVGSIAVIAWQPTLDMPALLGIVAGEFCFNLLVGTLLIKAPSPENERRLIERTA
jgi:hypothetical protein